MAVVVFSTPTGTRFADLDELEQLTGQPVRWEYRMPGTGGGASADVVLACPLTFNSVNSSRTGTRTTSRSACCARWRLRSARGRRPALQAAARVAPAFTASLETLRGMGVCVLFDPAAPMNHGCHHGLRSRRRCRALPPRGDTVSGDENAAGARIARARRRRGLSQSVLAGPGRPVGVLAVAGRAG